MVGRALDREIERQLDAVLARASDKRTEIVQRAQLGMNSLMPAFGRTDGVDAARDLPASGVSALLRPLRLVRPIGWIGGI